MNDLDKIVRKDKGLEKALQSYINDKHTKEECIGFIDGYNYTKWVSTKERMPYNDVDVLWLMENGYMIVAHVSESEGRNWITDGEDYSESPLSATHWQPLPPRPTK